MGSQQRRRRMGVVRRPLVIAGLILGVVAPSAALLATAPTAGAVAPASVTAISPATGAAAGGTTVTITGTNFDNGVNQVWFGGTQATFTITSTTTATATSPPGTGAVDVRVANLTGPSAVTTGDTFTYTGTLPTPAPWVADALTLPVGHAAQEAPDVACASAGLCLATITAYATTTSHPNTLVDIDTAGSWSGLEALPLPATAPATLYEVAGTAPSCDGADSCVVAGTYTETTASVQHPFIDTYADGSWAAAAVTLPGNAFDDRGSLHGLSCTADGTCAAVGAYLVTRTVPTGTLITTPLGVTLAGGVWTSTTIPTPPGATNGTKSSATSVWCDAGAPCVAAGYAQATGRQQTFLAVESAGTWTSGLATLPDSAAVTHTVRAAQGACTTGGTCIVVGSYYTETLTLTLGGVETWNGSGWTGQNLVLPTDDLATSTSTLEGVSCDGVTTCVAVGWYETTGLDQAVIDTYATGSWTGQGPTATVTGTGPTAQSLLKAVTCPATGSCTAVGAAWTGTEAPVVATLVSGVWAWQAVTLPPDAGTAPDTSTVTVVAVSCSSPTTCLASGQYEVPGASYRGLLLQSSGSVYTATAGPEQPSATGTNEISTVSCAGTTCVGGGTYTYAGPVPFLLTRVAAVAPTVSSLSPTSGPAKGGTVVTITGNFFNGVTGVQFGSVAGTSLTVTSATSLTVTAPAGSGTVAVTVTGPGGTSVGSPSSSFTYTATSATGYDLVGSDGGVFVFDAPGQTGGFYGSLPGIKVVPNTPVIGIVPTKTDQGYFLVAEDGGVFAFGDAPFLGSLPGIHVTPSAPIEGIVATDTDQGYLLVGADGGVFAFGKTSFLGSLPGRGIVTTTVIGIAATPSGNGYWVVLATGTVYAFGTAKSFPSTATTSTVFAIAGTPTGGGYWLVTELGGVYAYGNAKKPAKGTLPAIGVVPNLPVIGIVPTAGTTGYWLLGADGGIFAFGTAPFYGSLPGLGVNVTNIVGAVPN